MTSPFRTHGGPFMEAGMSSREHLSTTDLATLFNGEVTTRGGVVKDVFDDGEVLLARSVMPLSEEVVRGDRVHGGVALRSAMGVVEVHPYTFREVCRNGAIQSTSLGTEVVTLDEFTTPQEAAGAVAEAIAICADPEVFTELVGRLRASRDRRADLTLNLLPMLSRMPAEFASRLLRDIMDEFHKAHDFSRYGLFNAVTAVARDTSDPETRWRLEELGGSLVKAMSLVPRPGFSTATRRLMGV
jgi:hypothetical protein